MGRDRRRVQILLGKLIKGLLSDRLGRVGHSELPVV
jgi:hypothetical protein